MTNFNSKKIVLLFLLALLFASMISVSAMTVARRDDGDMPVVDGPATDSNPDVIMVDPPMTSVDPPMSSAPAVVASSVTNVVVVVVAPEDLAEGGYGDDEDFESPMMAMDSDEYLPPCGIPQPMPYPGGGQGGPGGNGPSYPPTSPNEPGTPPSYPGGPRPRDPPTHNPGQTPPNGNEGAVSSDQAGMGTVESMTTHPPTHGEGQGHPGQPQNCRPNGGHGGGHRGNRHNARRVCRHVAKRAYHQGIWVGVFSALLTTFVLKMICHAAHRHCQKKAAQQGQGCPSSSPHGGSHHPNKDGFIPVPQYDTTERSVVVTV